MSDITLDLVNSIVGKAQPSFKFSFTKRDTIIYALGVGAGADWLNADELKYVYELSPDFCALPTMPVTYSSRVMIQDLISGDLHGIKFNPMMLVHGEESLEIKKTLPVEGTVTCTPTITNIFDKGSGLVMVSEMSYTDESGDVIAVTETSMFIRGLGGFGGERGNSEKITMPERDPDVIHEEKTLERQALIFRLSGDINPLHADPTMAKMGNFDTPILHGLSTYGFGGRAVLKHFADNDPTKFKSMQGRFSQVVFPGNTLVTEMWETDEGILFQMKAKERDVVVFSGGKAVVG